MIHSSLPSVVPVTICQKPKPSNGVRVAGHFGTTGDLFQALVFTPLRAEDGLKWGWGLPLSIRISRRFT